VRGKIIHELGPTPGYRQCLGDALARSRAAILTPRSAQTWARRIDWRRTDMGSALASSGRPEFR